MESYDIPRHKVCVSFHNADEGYKDLLVKREEYSPEKGWQSIFDDYSVGGGEIDSNDPDEKIRETIRDKYIKGAKVLILLCGAGTKNRKIVDWELHAAMFNTDNNPKLGILVINLPSIEWLQSIVNGGDKNEGQLLADSAIWRAPTSRKEYEDELPYMPSRIIDNCEASIDDKSIVGISSIDWSKIEKNDLLLKELIDDAFKRGMNHNLHYNHSAPLRRKNS